jgi:sugar O-acyltransferase (sialic acid O-acetyltransferase NeuD family)
MKNLIIIGARGYGREIFNCAIQCKEYNLEWNIKGFLDDKMDALNDFNYNVPILSSVEDYKIEKDDVFICALGSVIDKKKYVEIIINKGGEFINLIHPNSVINSFVKMGTGIIICAFCSVSNDVNIGNFVTVQGYSLIGHDVVIEDWCHLNAYSFMGGFAKLENEVTLHTRATILPKVQIGRNSIVGVGSVVIKKVKSDVTVFGTPAREIF